MKLLGVSIFLFLTAGTACASNPQTPASTQSDVSATAPGDGAATAPANTTEQKKKKSADGATQSGFTPEPGCDE